jgi:hypothetical protein
MAKNNECRDGGSRDARLCVPTIAARVLMFIMTLFIPFILYVHDKKLNLKSKKWEF